MRAQCDRCRRGCSDAFIPPLGIRHEPIPSLLCFRKWFLCNVGALDLRSVVLEPKYLFPISPHVPKATMAIPRPQYRHSRNPGRIQNCSNGLQESNVHPAPPTEPFLLTQVLWRYVKSSSHGTCDLVLMGAIVGAPGCSKSCR